MFNSNIDTLVVLSSVNRFYFSKVEAVFGCVILHEEDKIYLTDVHSFSQTSKALDGWKVILIKQDELFEAINSELTALNAETVGFEEKYIPLAQYRRLKSVCSAFRFEPASSLIEEKRAIKTEEEIQKIAAAQLITQKTLTKVLPLIKPGVTEHEVVANIIYEMLMLGADGVAFDPIVAFGDGSAPLRRKMSKRKLEKNEIVLVELGAKFDGYCADMTRTFCVGQPNEKIAKIHQVVLEAQEYALNNIKAGMTGHEVDSFAREYIISHGYGKEFSHPVGHGVGLERYELPKLAPESNMVLEPNMVLTIEPGIYVEGLGGVRIEDFVVVKENGILNLTNFDKKINL